MSHQLFFYNVRRGFAANSSSSHSMIVFPENGRSDEEHLDGEDFGWETFTLASPEYKKNYLSSLFFNPLLESFGPVVASQILEDLGLSGSQIVGIDHQSQMNFSLTSTTTDANRKQFTKELLEFIANSQDILILGGNDNGGNHPLSDEQKTFDITQWLNLSRLRPWKDPENNTWSLFSDDNGLLLRFSFTQPSLANEIHQFVQKKQGINDEEEVDENKIMKLESRDMKKQFKELGKVKVEERIEQWMLQAEQGQIEIGREDVSVHLSEDNFVEDEDGEDDETGLSYQEIAQIPRRSAPEILQQFKKDFSQIRWSEKASSRPNLVDVKITDFCPYGCAYCYQGSTPKGQHARLEDIVTLARQLSAAQVFEVALGGGEPTLHPQFKEILTLFDHFGIRPNFTTRNATFVKDPKNKKALELIGTVAFSIDTAEDLQKIIKQVEVGRETWDKTNRKITAQVVVGTQSEEEFKKIVHMCHNNDIRLTLLGYKNNGFGQDYRSSDTEHEQAIQHAEAHWTSWILDVQAEIQKKYLAETKDRWPSMPYLWFCIDTALAQKSDHALQKILPQQIFTAYDENRNRNKPANYLSEGQMSVVQDNKEVFKPVHYGMVHRNEGALSMYIDAVQMKMMPSSFVSDMINPEIITPELNQALYQPFDQDWQQRFKQFVPAIQQYQELEKEVLFNKKNKDIPISLVTSSSKVKI